MHELSVAQLIIERVAGEMRRRPGTRPCAVGVKIGEVSGIDRDALAFGFEALVKNTEWEQLRLEIEYCPWRHRCGNCGKEFAVSDFATACPACGNAATTLISGEELDIGYIEVED